MNKQQSILAGHTALGIELGSTRIKAVLIGRDYRPLAIGSHNWENQLVDGIWTYSLADARAGLQACYADLKADVHAQYGVPLTTVGVMGISGMMHGYLPFDASGKLLTPFRTWRNTMTAQAAERLTAAFGFSIPQRWSVAHLYQAILNNEPHVGAIAHLTTLAGYIHWQLTGVRVLGVCEASGMFPIGADGQYNADMLATFDALSGQECALSDLLPRVLTAGDAAGRLTAQGAALLDPTGDLQPGIAFCPPEGDAGTGMVATDAVTPRSGNVSAGTSVFAMAVLEKQLSRPYPEIDMVTTPAGDPVAMVHCNNGCGDIDAWVALFEEFAKAAGLTLSKSQLYQLLFAQALDADADGGGLLSYNYLSGEHITGFEAGRPLLARSPSSRLTLPNFMRTQLFTSLGALHTGMRILYDNEGLRLDRMAGHGGFFKTPVVGQRIMAAALNTPVTVSATAGEGGPWGMAVLAAFLRDRNGAETLGDFLTRRVFADNTATTQPPLPDDVAGFAAFMRRYTAGLAVERAAIDHWQP